MLSFQNLMLTLGKGAAASYAAEQPGDSAWEQMAEQVSLSLHLGSPLFSSCFSQTASVNFLHGIKVLNHFFSLQETITLAEERVENLKC